jgi:SAM-dependent methyltransferase
LISVNEQTVRDFWQAHPCGDNQVGGLSSSFGGDYRSFFDAYDNFRYTREAHILRGLDRFDFKGKRLLEIGLGQGADSEQLIRRGARWSGLDITPEAVGRVRMRAAIRDLPIEDLKVGSALNIPYDDRSFDIVFSHGVLHHIPDIARAQAEIARVLRPNGKLIIMVYARYSLNYQVAIRFIRRAGLLAISLLGVNLGGIYEQHRQNARAVGLLKYLDLTNFVHRSTDGPHNPYSKVYSLKQVAADFSAFRVHDSFKLWMHAPPLPISALPGESMLGWHLWVTLEPFAKARSMAA